MLLSLSGCGGCFSSNSPKAVAERKAELEKRQEELKKKKKKKIPSFKISRVRVRPHATDTQKTPALSIKPGHWVSMVQEMKSNKENFHGEMEIGVVDKKDRPVFLDHTPYRLMTSRPALLPKGQTKHLEMPIFVPHGSKQVRLATTLQGPGGSSILPSVEFFNAMPSYQYHLVVLAKESDRYGFLKTLDSILAPHPETLGDIVRSSPHYLVVPMEPGRRTPLPSHALAWTSIAYLIWDDVPPDSLTPEQQTALIDWLHWGGQLLISGPDSIDSLAGSFLAPYLPIQPSNSRTIVAAEVQEISDYWTLPARRHDGKKTKQVSPLSIASKWSGIELVLSPEREHHTQFVENTNSLIAEGTVGRGRIVVTAMHLTEPELYHWNGFDGLFNACLLRRPSREFREDIGIVQVTWDKMPGRNRDARLTTHLNYFSRDLGIETYYVSGEYVPVESDFKVDYDLSQPGESWSESMQQEPAQRGGVAAWNDLSQTALAARESLVEAAGIKVPKSSFVLLVLAVYLIGIVPVNWLIFHMLGRIEWAWIAAPVIAVVCAFVVIRLAQLDIGFARAQTEIALLEMYDDYPRAHLSRYTAFYTSLSTTYEMKFDDLSAVVQPLADQNFKMVPGQSRTTVTYHRHQSVQLRGLGVASNTTDMVHSEQMLQLPGGFTLGAEASWPRKVTNNTGLPLAEACLLFRGKDEIGEDYLAVSWIGELAPGATVTCDLDRRETLREGKAPSARPEAHPSTRLKTEPSGLANYLAEKRNAQRQTEDSEPHKKLDLERLFALAQDSSNFAPGEVRLVGRVDQPLEGLEVQPAANHLRASTLVIAHLRASLPNAPERDKNSRLGALPVLHNGFSN